MAGIRARLGAWTSVDRRPDLGATTLEGSAALVTSGAAVEPHGYREKIEEALAPVRESAFYRFFQRAVDITASVVALTLFGVILPLIALAIKIDNPGPVFFMQERVGMNRRRRRRIHGGRDRRKVVQPGQPFNIIKLRSMRVDAEANGPQWAKKNDDRVTRVGKFLRKTRLDEVPQFVNVLRGEMSLIGPRPERLHFVRQLEQEIPNYGDRLQIRPGITGLAQVVNGYDRDEHSVRRKVQLDRMYIRRRGVRQDLGILARTVRVVLKGEGAH